MKQVIIYILSFLGILSQMSCDDQLNALPTQSKVVGNVIVDQKSAEVALNGYITVSPKAVTTEVHLVHNGDTLKKSFPLIFPVISHEPAGEI